MILRLALKDIQHDWLLSTCLVLAISSIIAPLLILFGLKFGTIQTLRSRLIQDPKNREIRPITTKSFHRDWFENLLKDNPEVSFIVPMTRQISTAITAKHVFGGRERLSLMATAAGDPLLLENGVTIPEHELCVLTEPAAQALNVSVGDELTFGVRRIVQGKTESGEFPVRVAGILEERASGLKTAFVRLDVIEAVEDFKDGRAVPAYGWGGKLPAAYPVYEGAAVFTPSPLSKLDEVLLANNTGFTQVTNITGDHAVTTLGYTPQQKWSVYLARVKQRAVTEDSIQAVRNKLRGKGAIVVPWVQPFAISLTSSSDAALLTFQLHAVTEKVGLVSSLMLPPQLNFDKKGNDLQQRVLVQKSPLKDDNATLSFTAEDRKLSVPITVIPGDVAPASAYASASFVGKLNLLRYRNVKYDKKTNSLLLSRRGYAGFRMYATTIDEVEAIQQKLESEGITVHTEKERIGEVRRLDQYMSLIFWLIAAVGVVGGISALTASLYASVERKKKELNILRLLGLLKREIVLFPVFQGLLLSSGGLVLATIVFMLVSRVINQLFSSHLQATESLCTLSINHFIILVAGVFVLSIFSATFAALQATRLDPAEALRDE